MVDQMMQGNDGAIDASLGRTFRRAGRLGFWMQIVIGVAPIVIGGGVLMFNRAVVLPGGRVDLIGYFALLSLLILLFTTLWFYRYTRLAPTLEGGGGTWTYRRLTRTVGVGLAASSVGILFSTVVMIVEVAYLLVLFLEAPQGGVPVIQTTAESASWISALDLVSLMALILMVAAEIIVLVLGLWLLYKVASAAAQRSRAPDFAATA